MKYFSTRNTNLSKEFKEITMQGMPNDGGLYLPKQWPNVQLSELKGLNYDELAFEIIFPYCKNSIEEESLRKILLDTYMKFHHPKTAPLHTLENNKNILEL